MMNYTNRFQYLLTKYLDEQLSPDESEEFYGYVASGDFEDVLDERIGKALVEKGAEQSTKLSDEASNHILQQIIGSGEQATVVPINKKATSYRWLLSVAAIVICIALGLWVTVFNGRVSEKSFASTFKKDNPETIYNTADSAQTVLLPDGSRVVLQSGSSLNYSKQLFAGKRQVYLEGDANFYVTKNPSSPFYVYYHDVVTKVLGTSFNISTNTASGNIEVSVFTGKVQVYENGTIHKGANTSEGVIVTPNQKAIYKAKDREFKASLVAKPVEVVAENEVDKEVLAESRRSFVFENTRLQQVLKTLEERYNVEIVVENDNIYNCTFSGDLGTPDFFDKLQIICLATNSAFEISETKIFIKGKGCK